MKKSKRIRDYVAASQTSRHINPLFVFLPHYSNVRRETENGRFPSNLLLRFRQGGIVKQIDHIVNGGRRRADRWTLNTTPTGYRYTNQRQDEMLGLYDYNARYYDPTIGRFISADNIIPNSDRLAPLTVGFHETLLLSSFNVENSQLVLFGAVNLWSPKMKQAFGVPQGPRNIQTLNRYSYVLNNSLRLIDPSGHQDEIPEIPNVPTLTPDPDDPEWYIFTWDSPDGFIEFRIHSDDPRFGELQGLIEDLEQETKDLQAALDAMETSNESSVAALVGGIISIIMAIGSLALAMSPETVGVSLVVGFLVALVFLVIGAMLFGFALFYDSATSQHARQTLRREIRDLNHVLYGQDDRPGLYQIIEDISDGQWSFEP